jgi:hypothetical protein
LLLLHPGINVMAKSRYGVQEFVQDSTDSGRASRVPSTHGTKGFFARVAETQWVKTAEKRDD